MYTGIVAKPSFNKKAEHKHKQRIRKNCPPLFALDSSILTLVDNAELI
jgi:hypothetical protein